MPPRATRCLDPGDDDYPAALGALATLGWRRAPPLYVRGTLPSGPALAVVGTRRSTPQAEAFAEALVRELSSTGIAIGSGGARGIDAAAHRAALEARGRTFVVTTGSLDEPYPPEHAGLFEDVLEAGGAVLSLEPDGAERVTAQFLRRNHVLAALCHAALVVEAPHRSGARHTARVARSLGRPVLAVPHAPWSHSGAGCAQLLRAGATPVTSPADVLAVLASCCGPLPRADAHTALNGRKAMSVAGSGIGSGQLTLVPRSDERTSRTTTSREPTSREQASREQASREQASREPASREPASREPASREQASRKQASREPTSREQASREPASREPASREPISRAQEPLDPGSLEPDERAVFAVVEREPVHLDVVCERARISARAAQAALLQLCLLGVVREGPPGQFARA